jgi:hypothetical protein
MTVVQLPPGGEWSVVTGAGEGNSEDCDLVAVYRGGRRVGVYQGEHFGCDIDSADTWATVATGNALYLAVDTGAELLGIAATDRGITSWLVSLGSPGAFETYGQKKRVLIGTTYVFDLQAAMRGTDRVADPQFVAYDIRDGHELWRASCPAGQPYAGLRDDRRIACGTRTYPLTAGRSPFP